MQAATSETESKSLDLSICVHHYTLRAPCPKGQGNRIIIPGTCVQYPGLQGGGALGDASTLGSPAGSIAASAHGPRCRGGGNEGWGKGCRRRHRSGGGPPASRDAYGRGRHSATQRTCARRAGRPTRRTGGRVGPTAARRGASNRATRRREKLPTSRRNRSRRAGSITRGSSRAR